MTSQSRETDFYDPNAGWLYGIHKKRSFTMAVNGTGYQLSTAEGYAVLDSEGNPITFDGDRCY